MRRTVLERFPAGGPRGSWPAEEFARARRDEGLPAEVVMDLDSDAFLVVIPRQGSGPDGRSARDHRAQYGPDSTRWSSRTDDPSGVVALTSNRR
ncbi:hypothetical protein SSP531S_07130 [Streptomyces spongiicola]|uniref:Uncharacterized protein n=1 Tax=Streptomyces spongiicola TaxID=1690221 RepID=A0A388SRY6_9ACTN|nr:hypothetical protein SSP531S_07130 [Streptomyces spongiicola]